MIPFGLLVGCLMMDFLKEISMEVFQALEKNRAELTVSGYQLLLHSYEGHVNIFYVISFACCKWWVDASFVALGRFTERKQSISSRVTFNPLLIVNGSSGEEDPSFLDMARVVVILIHPAVRYATTFAHYPDRYAKVATLANIIKSFSHYFLLDITIDWYTNIEAVAHMMSDSSQLDKVQSYNGKDCVIVGNEAYLPITHIESQYKKGGGNRSS
ncbi:hypothetical protein POTOM_019440 [Populus tomentosa]|uniref:Uncharacterized protein n=1 Tax=Populus tomentosa TaxID=118781 RepID=A0A8X8CU67_POPTO|nr:hypothetical protein POTOM_019440 [Populus tomentosa]